MTERTHFVLVGKRLKGKPAEVPRDKLSKFVEDYPNKVLAEVTESQAQELLKQGFKIEDLSSRTKIRVGKLAIDPTIAEEQEEAVGPAEEATETEYHFVQFVGPVKQEWLEELKRASLVPISYYHDFTYLVHGKADDVKKLEKSANVRATMPYGKGLKLDRASSELEEKGEGEKDFWILVLKPGGKVDETIKDVEDLGVTIKQERYEASYYEKVLATIPASLIQKVAGIPAVLHIEEYQVEELEDEVADQIVAGNYNALNVPFSGYLAWLSDMGLDGSGVSIGICDGGVDDDHPAFTGRITRVDGGKAQHGTMVAGQAAANYQTPEPPEVAGDLIDADGFIYGIGIAFQADIIFRRNSGADTTRARDIVTNAGPSGENGSIMNNSWGRGTADPMDYQADEHGYDEIVRDADNTNPGNTPLIVCFSSGNDGANGLTRPKAAKNPIVTGNFENHRPADVGAGADNINERVSSSSIGNCDDGRVKPDVVTPGQWTASAAYPQPSSGAREISHWLRYGGGTSAASPKTAGACALIMQWWRQRHRIGATEQTPSPAIAKAMLINGAVDTGEGGPIPNEEQGWGRVNLNNVFNPSVPAIYVDQSILFEPGSPDIEFDIEPVDTSQPMKTTLVWTDVPGAIGSGTGADPLIPGDTGNPALVNVLGLEITQGANTWFGNNFAGGWSQTGGQQDAIQNQCPGEIVNNVQNVFIQAPASDYHVRIAPENIVGDCLDTTSPFDIPADFRQDFALVVQNARLKTNEPIDVMLVIDRTGSMSGDRIAAAIASGQEFFDLIPNGKSHKAGLVSYAAPYSPIDAPIDDKATVDVEMDDVDDALKATAHGVIAGMSASGYTSIGAGLIKAMEQIVEHGEPLHRKTIVLLSDGKENRPPNVGEILPLLRKEYKVHAIGLGGSINAALMQQIADETHAEFLHTLDPDETVLLYQQIFALEEDEEIVGQEEGLFGAGEEETAEDEQTKTFPIVNSDSKATFIVTWKKPEVSFDVELESPKGNRVDPAKAQSSRNMNYVKRDTHVIYTLQRPVRATDWEGGWTVKVKRSAGSSKVAETYTASVLVRSSLKLKLLLDKIKYFTKDYILVKAQITDKQYVLKNGLKMTTKVVAPVKGYGTILATTPKELFAKANIDVMSGALAALDKLNEEELKALYTEDEETAEITFEVGGEEARPAAGRFMTPHTAKLKKLFRPTRDGIYTYKIKVEGRTASGARYTRVRRVSKYVGAKVNAVKSITELKPVVAKQPTKLKLRFTPKDVHGNLVGPGRSPAIKVKVDNGTLKGKVEDLLDGSYTAEIEADACPTEVGVTVSMDEVSIAVRAPVTVPAELIPAPEKKLEGKVEQLRFDEKGNFQGFTLRTLNESVEFQSMSSRLARVLMEAVEKDLTVIISCDGSTADVTDVSIESP